MYTSSPGATYTVCNNYFIFDFKSETAKNNNNKQKNPNKKPPRQISSLIIDYGILRTKKLHVCSWK